MIFYMEIVLSYSRWCVVLFSSLTFLAVFLPVVLFIYYISKDKYRNYILLVASLLFYSWGEPKFVIIMLISIIFNYYFAILIDKFRNKIRVSKLILILSLIFNIGLLIFFKYSNFLITNLNYLLDLNISSLKISLPIGISFYTFQILSYVVDVYRNSVKVQNNICYLGAYISFFPQLIAGPIVRYSDIERQLRKRSVTLKKFSMGIKRFIIGLGKKVIIANNVAIIADSVFDSSSLANYGGFVLLLGTIAYTMQIYFDFSGYSDMAIGLGRMFGFEFLENFNYPYMSTSITDFWRRWHISLSSWFRDYIYIPLGGNRKGIFKLVRNIFIVWMLTGLWHGANWNYVIWGVYFGILLMIEKLFLNKYFNKFPVILRWCYAFILVNVGWIIFRVENFSNISLNFTVEGLENFFANNYNLINQIPFLILAFVLSFPIFPLLESKIKNEYIINLVLIIIFVISICFLINNTYNPFIYFRF